MNRNLETMSGLEFCLCFAMGDVVLYQSVALRIMSIQRESGFTGHSYNVVFRDEGAKKTFNAYCGFPFSNQGMNRFTML